MPFHYKLYLSSDLLKAVDELSALAADDKLALFFGAGARYKPCTLRPIPYTLYPIPYSLYPIVYTLYIIPYTLSLFPIPYTL